MTVPAQPSATREAQRRLSRDYDERWPVFARCFGARLSEDAVRAGASLRGRLYLVAAGFEAPPHAILHGDPRVANFLFVGDGGDGDDGGGAALVDFEAVGVGRPALDLAAFVAASLATGVRRALEGELLRTYHAQLGARGVACDFDALVADYRKAVALCLTAPVLSAPAWARELAVSAEPDALMELVLAVVERIATHVADVHGGGGVEC